MTMALRNISNIQLAQLLQQMQPQPQDAQLKHVSSKSANIYHQLSHHPNHHQQPVQILANNENFNRLPTSSSSSTSTASSCGTGGSVQIRTSSPISSSSGSEMSGPANTVISPSKFMKAVHNSRKSKQQQQIAYQQQHQPPAMRIYQQHPQAIPSNYTSLKELAYEKMRKQQAIESELKQTFNIDDLNNQHDDKLKSNGKLKLSIYNNMNHLTIHVMNGRSYKLPNGYNLMNHGYETYVKITMLPDMEKRFKKCLTTPITPINVDNSSSIYNYDAKFSFELDNEADLNNRLIISVWCVIPNQPQHHTIGLFSFKIKHLMKQHRPKPTWYHLLPLKYGLAKHLRCQSSKSSSSAGATQSSSSSSNNGLTNTQRQVTNVNKDLIGMEKISLVLKKSNENDGYGFTLMGGCPCRVGKVDLDKTAYKCGLRAGDYISKINNKNVSRATCESVVKLIKSCRFRLDLQIHRQTVTKQQSLQSIQPIKQHQPIQQQQFYNCQQNHLLFNQPQIFSNQIISTNAINYNPMSIQPQCLYEKQTSQGSLANKQLEVVFEEDENALEEDEEEEEFSMNDEDDDDQEYEDDEEEEDVEVVKYESHGFIRNEEPHIRHVDSSTTELSSHNSNEDEVGEYEEVDLSNNVDTLRRVAAQFYSSSNQMHTRKANIMSLRNLKLN